MKKEKIIRVALVIMFSLLALYSIVLFIIIPTLIMRQAVIETTTFSNSQTIEISDKLNIDSKNLKITKLQYSHINDTVFTIYIEFEDIESLEKNYNKSVAEDGTIKYHNKKNKNINCILTKAEPPYKATFVVREFDKDLEDIALNK